MANKYGYMAKIGADTSGLQSAMKAAEADARNISAELRAVNEGLKFDPENTELLKQKQDLLAKSIENTSQKLEKLKSVQEDVNKAVENGDLSVTEQQRYTREIANTESALRRYQTELKGTALQTKNANSEIITFGDLLKSNIIGDLAADGIRAAGSAIKNFAMDGIALASDLQEVQNVVDTTFGDGAEQIYKWADAASESFGLSSLQAQSFNGTLGAMLKSMGLADEAVMKMSTDMVGLAGDMASFYNLDIDTAFQKIRSGIAGETEPLKQLGIDMSVANLEAYALAQGIETAWKEMSQAEQTTLRYQYLLSQTADAQGDFAKTSDSFANQQRNLETNMQNLSASLGQELLPYLNEGITLINEKLPQAGPSIEKIADILGKLVGFALDNHEAILSLAAGYAAFAGSSAIGNGIAALANGIKALKTANDAAAVSQTAMNTAANANPYVLLASVIAALVVGITAYAKSTTTAIDAVNDKYEELKKNTEDTIAESETEIALIRDKAAKYEELRGKIERTAGEEVRLRELAQDLQKYMPVGTTLIDEQTGAYNSLAGSIDNVVKSMKNQATMEAYKDEYTELIKLKEEALENYWEASNKLDDTSGPASILAADASIKARNSLDDVENRIKELENKMGGLAEDIAGAGMSVETTVDEPSASGVGAGAEDTLETWEENLKEMEKAWNEAEFSFKDPQGAIKTEEQLYSAKLRIWNQYGDKSVEEHQKYYLELIDIHNDFQEKEAKAAENAEEEQLKIAENAEKERTKLAEEAAEAELKAWEDNAKKVSGSLSDAYEELVDEKEKIKNDLISIDLSETVTTKDGKEIEVLTNLDEQIKKIDKYKNSLDRLKATGISDSLLDEIEGMNFEDGSRQRFIDSLLGLSQNKLDLYYSDWERLQEKSEQVSQDIVADSAEELNQATIDAVKSTFGNMPSAAYAEGVETAQSYLQGIIDSMGGVNSIDAISQMFTGAFSGNSGSAGKEQKMIPADTKITINIDGKTHLEATIQELIDKGTRTGGNTLNL